MKVVDLPKNAFSDITGGLRRLADEIDAGEYGDVCNVAWVMDADYAPISIGLLGRSPAPDAVCITLMQAATITLINRMGKT